MLFYLKSSMPIKYCFICILIAVIFAPINAQYAKTASCQNEAFDKKVNSYLSYSAPVLSVSEAYDKKNDLIFLDSREYNEYEVSHIPLARYVGYDRFKIENIKDIPKDKKIVVYCSIGYRSEVIATKLRNAGYKNVYNLFGSLFEWANAGHELKDKSGLTTHKIHTYNKKWSQWVLNPSVTKIW